MTECNQLVVLKSNNRAVGHYILLREHLEPSVNILTSSDFSCLAGITTGPLGSLEEFKGTAEFEVTKRKKKDQF